MAVNFPIDDSLVAEGQHHNELFAYYPDFSEGRTKYPGDSRAALAPLLAHKALAGQYKWILYGDDDTIWFLNGVVQLLQNLDPSMPYIVTGDCQQSPALDWQLEGAEKQCSYPLSTDWTSWA